MNIVELFQQRAQLQPNDVAIIDARRATTFAEMEAASMALAAQLQQAGLRTGDTVLVFYPMSAELYFTLGAIFRLGLVAMFIDPSAGLGHIEACCALHPPQALIASAKAHWLRMVCPALRQIPHKFVLGGWAPGAVSLTYDETARITSVPTGADSPALITFTSGSTGQPKAALRTHGFLVAQYEALRVSLGLHAGERNLATLPVFVLANLAAGVTSVIPNADLRFPGAIAPAPVIAQMERYELQSVAASPALLARIADDCWREGRQLRCLQKIFTGGAPVFPRLLDRLQHIAPNADIVAVYGSTEAEPIAELRRADLSATDRSGMHGGQGLLAGSPVSAIQLRILNTRWGAPVPPLTSAEFETTCCQPDQPGEIVVTGAHVLRGYLHGRGDDETKFRVQGTVWHRTGDAGYVDARGRVWLLGRCGARIEDARGIIYPFAVECAASHHPNVKRSALVSQQGKRVLVVELVDPNQSLRLLQQDLQWAELDEFRVLKTIPVDKRHNAKVDYPALVKLLA